MNRDYAILTYGTPEQAFMELTGLEPTLAELQAALLNALNRIQHLERAVYERDGK